MQNDTLGKVQVKNLEPSKEIDLDQLEGKGDSAEVDDEQPERTAGVVVTQFACECGGAFRLISSTRASEVYTCD